MAKIDLQYDLVNYTPASASPVEANFNRIEQHINQEVVERGGTVAMTAQLKLVGDPVSDLDAAPKQYVDQVLPIGLIMMYGGTVVPPGGRWAMCNGAELQSANYPALFAIIGTNFSPAGTPAGRFNLPNLTDRMPMGQGGLAGVGVTGGNRDATLPTHRHTGGTHSHGLEQHTHTMKNHSHHYNHFHGLGAGATGDESQPHYHTGSNGQPNYVMYNAGQGVGSGVGPENNFRLEPTTHWNIQNHTHPLVGSTVFVSQAGSGGVGGPEEGGSANTRGPSDNTSDYAGNWGGAQPAAAGDTDDRGVSPTNANFPPYVGLAFIMRVT